MVDINFFFYRNGKPLFLLPEKFTMDDNVINGLSEYTLSLKQHIQCCDSTMIEKVDSGDPKITQLNFVNFQPGSVIAIRYKTTNSCFRSRNVRANLCI